MVERMEELNVAKETGNVMRVRIGGVSMCREVDCCFQSHGTTMLQGVGTKIDCQHPQLTLYQSRAPSKRTVQ